MHNIIGRVDFVKQTRPCEALRALVALVDDGGQVRLMMPFVRDSWPYLHSDLRRRRCQSNAVQG